MPRQTNADAARGHLRTSAAPRYLGNSSSYGKPMDSVTFSDL